MLRGKKVIIRHIKKEDLKSIFEWSNEIKCSYFLLNGLGIYSLSEIELFYQELTDEELMIETINGETIGLVRVDRKDIASRWVLISLFISGRKYLKSGHYLESLRLISEYFFNEQNFNKINISFLKFENEYVALVSKIGFKKEAILKEQFYCRGKYTDLYIFGLLKEEYK